MKYESLTILIPSHSIEDLPLELPEQQAEGLLNAFAVAWHPLLLDSAGVMPNWERADEPPEELKDRLFLIPSASEDWVPCQWIDHARDQGAVLVTGVSERAAMIEQAVSPLGSESSADPELVSDFLALGHCYLQLEMLTRKMRYFNELDETRLQDDAVAAARAALANDWAAAVSHLHSCFEMLLEGRERFYPVDCYLADLCLLTPEMAGEEWSGLVGSDRSVNYLATAQDLQSIAGEQPEDMAALRARWLNEQQELLGGEWTETCNALLPLESVLPSFRKGLSAIERLCGRRPIVWARRKYGVGIQMPQLLDKLGYEAALHFVMDDGLYPDEEQGKHRWEGCDGSVIDAVSRIPLAADSASGMLRFPQRMAESMDYDHAALLIFARWPKMQSPWLEDFHRIEKYAPVLGRFVTFSDFFRTTDTPGRLSRHKAGDYLSPHLVASVAMEEADPISRYADHWARHHRLESVLWMSGMANLLQGRPIDADRVAALEEPIDTDCSEPAVAQRDELSRTLNEAHQETSRRLAETVVGRRGATQGCFVANSCSFGRRVAISWPQDVPPPQQSPAIVARQTNDEQYSLVVELPPCGFVWLPAGEATATARKTSRVLMAEENTLRNEQFEVRLSEVTGGIAQIKTYRRGPNRLSQQLAFRFHRELTVTVGEGEQSREEKTWYTEMRMDESRVISDGPLRGEIETRGRLVDPTNDLILARFTQLVRVWQGRPVVEIDVLLEPERLPVGDPWSNYFAARWAWSDSAAALTCSVHEGAQPVTSDRFEAPHFIEIADAERRATIHSLGLPFHRKTGPRMLDTLLVTAGETRQHFRCVVSVDDAFPMERSRDIFDRLEPVMVSEGPDQPSSGWFFHIDSRNVQITRLMPLTAATPSPEEAKTGGGELDPSTTDVDETPITDADGAGGGADGGPGQRCEPGVTLRLRETEGRACTARLRCFRTPARARQCDLLGKPLTDLVIDADVVIVELTAYEICDVEIGFA